jgi:uncharacterized membrane protein YcaP (DUF421 family)
MDGDFASDRMRRQERRIQAAGFALLASIPAAAILGLVGEPASVARAAGMYGFLLAVFRVAGRRTLAQATNFDLVLILIIGEATQQAMVGSDYSFSTAAVVISTLVVVDVALGKAKQRWRTVDTVVDGLPVPLIVAGRAHLERMSSEGVTMDDVLSSARETRGISRKEEIEAAVLERGGAISVIPARQQQN